jgi:hypothetical protein
MKPKIIEQLTIDTILDAPRGSADAHSTANGVVGERATVQGKHQLHRATRRDDKSDARSLPAADVTALLNLLSDIITSWQREAPPSSPPEAQALRQVTIRQADEAETYFGGMFRGPSPEDFAQSLASLARR